ncbi:MAG TPA: hypothetical protein RMH99_16605 [Sandaracinaceae bacterium LLY-WYZ-13_1]|nr:hypothetical protein [Sandaracinaceae bacterium LLY-WYZ-13_1]
MPLLTGPPGTDQPLGQGDVLEVPQLHKTTHDGQVVICPRAKLALVVSRDCVGVNKGQVLVASVVPVNARLLAEQQIRDGQDGGWKERLTLFRDLLKGLGAKRDGGLSPDRIYLGPLPGTDQRLVAQLDEISSLQLPTDPDAQQRWSAEARVARLAADALRALPTRLYWALCRTGFDDHDWLPTPDLKAVCSAGTAAVESMRVAHSDFEFRIANDEAGAANERKLDQLRTEAEKLRGRLEEAEGELRPYKEALSRRSSEVDKG